MSASAKACCSRRRARCVPRRCRRSAKRREKLRSRRPRTTRRRPHPPPLPPATSRNLPAASAGASDTPNSDTPVTDFIERIEPLARGYDVLLCDIWGVVHNGVAAFPEACDALSRFRSGGGTVILVTNAPRASEAVVRILDRMNISHDVYDAIVSSGDVTRRI